MKKSLLILTLSVAVGGMATANVVYIDQYGTGQNLITTGTTASNVGGADMVGGQRYAGLTNPIGVNADSLDINLAPNELDFNNGTGSSATLTIIYDGTGNTDGSPHFGLTSDLTSGGLNDTFVFTAGSDHLVSITWDIFSGPDSSLESQLVVPLANDGVPHTISTLLASFSSVGGSGGADFTNVSAIEMVIVGVGGLDLSMTQPTLTTASSPEPATFGLLGAALLGLGIVARKRKA